MIEEDKSKNNEKERERNKEGEEHIRDRQQENLSLSVFQTNQSRTYLRFNLDSRWSTKQRCFHE